MKKLFSTVLLQLALVLPPAWAAAPDAASPGAALALSAAPLPAANDLGQGLTYLLPVANGSGLLALPPGSLVLDFRQVKFSNREMAAWLDAIRARPAGQQVCFALISPATPAPMLAALAVGVRGCITVGRAAPAFQPDETVATDAASDGRAIALLAGGARPADLLLENATKVRHDEVELGKAHAAGQEPPDEDEDLKAEAPAASPIDRVLQRAVQLHRGLLALGKLPKA
jgi:hypothetical protein